jgi:hypothetical protein
MARATISAVAVGALVLGAAACGSDGGVALPQWLTEADAACVQARHELEASDPVTGAGNPAVPVRARAEVVKTQADDIDDLGEPAERRREAQAFTRALEDQARALDRLADALLDDPAAAAGALGAAVAVANERVTQTADELGLASCSVFASGSAVDPGAPATPEAPPVDEVDPDEVDPDGSQGGFVEEG